MNDRQAGSIVGIGITTDRQTCRRVGEALESGAITWGSYVPLHWHYTLALEREALYIGRADDCLLEK
jgi:hypothetical protein